MSTSSTTRERDSPAGRAPTALTVPNVITSLRLAGCGVLLWLSMSGHARAFIVLFAVLMVTDWLDGKLAVLLDQKTVLGARLDSIADVLMYAVLVFGTAGLKPDFVHAEATALAAMIGSYALSVITALVRFRRLPAYHTRAAKTCWLLVWVGAITLLEGGPAWPARVVIFAVILVNVEAIAISLVLDRWETNVPSIVHAHRRSRPE